MAALFPIFTLTVILTAAAISPRGSLSTPPLRRPASTCPAASLAVLVSLQCWDPSFAPPWPPALAEEYAAIEFALAGRFISGSRRLIPLTVFVSHRAVLPRETGLTETARGGPQEDTTVARPPPPHSMAPTGDHDDDDAVPRPPSPPKGSPSWFYPSINVLVKFGIGLVTVAIIVVLIYVYCPWFCHCLQCFNDVMGWITTTIRGRTPSGGSRRLSIVGGVPLPVLAAAGGVGIATVLTFQSVSEASPQKQAAAGIASAALRFGSRIGRVGWKFAKKLTKRDVATSTTSISGRDSKLLLAGAFLGVASMTLYMKGPAIFSYIKKGGQKAIHWVKTRAGPGEVEADSEAGHKQDKEGVLPPD